MNLNTITQTLAAAVADLENYAASVDDKPGAMSDEDRDTLKSKMDNVRRLKAREEITEGKAYLKSLGTDGGRSGRSPSSTTPRADSKSTWAETVATKMTGVVGEYGVKAITVGGIDIPSPVEATVIKPVEPVRVLDLLINRKPLAGNEFEFLRQSVRTNNAAPVPDGTLKPTSVYTFEDVFDRARVFAHLSEPIPLRYLADHSEMRAILQSQMAEDLHLKVEADVLAGPGTGEHFLGLSGTVGIQEQVYGTDVLTTLRKARTKLTTSGETPTAWVLNWADLEAVDLTRDGDGNFVDGITEKVFGNLPVVGTSALPAGTAYLGDWSQIRLYVREAGRLDADVSGELFTKNQVRLRYEGRFGSAVLRPSAFVAVDLTAA